MVSEPVGRGAGAEPADDHRSADGTGIRAMSRSLAVLARTLPASSPTLTIVAAGLVLVAGDTYAELYELEARTYR